MGQWNVEWVQAGVALCALWAAVVAGLVSWRAYKTSYRPILRVVALSVGDDSGGRIFCPDRLALKNLGRGPAISIVIVKGSGLSEQDLIGEVDALEPLGETYGPHFRESARVGRVRVFLHPELIDGRSYRVFYMDMAGGWHLTEFSLVGHKFRIHRVVPRVDEEIPRWVRERSQIVGNF